MYTAGTAFLEALTDSGIEYIFANFGSDHPALLEGLAQAKAEGRKVPQVVTCPNEMVAMGIAHGYAQATGRAQMVAVHVDCGTQALAGAVHNAARGRVPVLMFAGLSPITLEGELQGSRCEHVQWLQDVPDQRGIVRNYVRYENELRSGHNVKQLVMRAMQFAHSDPQGPVYLVGAREIFEQKVPKVKLDPRQWQPVASPALTRDAASGIARQLARAKRPLVVTSYLGRSATAAGELLHLCHRLGIGVREAVPNYMNYPIDDELHLGAHWNEPFQNPELAEADLILVLDSDIPWMPAVSKPSKRARIIHIDVDPLKDTIPTWYIGAHESYRADTALALGQINAALDRMKIDPAKVEDRRAHYAARHATLVGNMAEAAKPGAGGTISAALIGERVSAALSADDIMLNEGITNYTALHLHSHRNKPGTMYGSGAGSLGWNGPAAVGIKMANPDRVVASITGDGSYMFSLPDITHWIARQYQAPFLQVVLNNRGWKAPRLSMLSVHPQGYASRANDIGIAFDPPPDYAGIAAAGGGAFAKQVKTAGELDGAIAEALKAVRQEKRSAVLDVWLPQG